MTNPTLDKLNLKKYTKNKLALALLLTSPLLIYLLYVILPQDPNDWTKVFYDVGKIPFRPYENPLFINPPWLALLLSPISLLPLQLSRALNAFFAFFFLTLLIQQSKGNGWSYLLTFSSFPFVGLLANGTVDWIVAVGLVLGSPAGIPFLLIKPQTGALVGLLWFKKSEKKAFFVLGTALFLVFSFLIWGEWVSPMLQNINATPLGDWNASLFPWSVPVGIYLLYLSLKKEDVLAAIAAGLCLSPYFAAHSLIVGFAILSARYVKIAGVAWILLWLSYFYL